MSRQTLIIDAAVAAVLAALVLTLSPGLAVTGLIALVVVLVCEVSFLVDARARRRRRAREAAGRLSRPRGPSRPRRG